MHCTIINTMTTRVSRAVPLSIGNSATGTRDGSETETNRRSIRQLADPMHNAPEQRYVQTRYREVTCQFFCGSASVK